MRLFLGCAVLYLSLTGCGNQDPGRDLYSLDSETPPTSYATGAALARASRVTTYCEQPENCPPGVATLAIAQGGGVELCTGFLIAADRLRTSRSCVPEVYRSRAGACANGIFAAFPQTRSSAAQTIPCAEIVDPVSDSQWITLRLESASRASPFRALETLPEGGQILTLYQAQAIPLVSDPATRLLRTRCRLAERLAYPRESRAAHITFCATSNAGRGAPLLDRTGTVRGSVETAVNETEWAELRRMRPSTYRWESPPAGFASFFACEGHLGSTRSECKIP